MCRFLKHDKDRGYRQRGQAGEGRPEQKIECWHPSKAANTLFTTPRRSGKLDDTTSPGEMQGDCHEYSRKLTGFGRMFEEQK